MKIDLTEVQIENIRRVLSTHKNNMLRAKIDAYSKAHRDDKEVAFYQDATERCEELIEIFKAPEEPEEEDEDNEEDPDDEDDPEDHEWLEK